MLDDLVAGNPARSVDDVIAIMAAIDARLPDEDGVKWFNRLYLLVTRSVGGAILSTSFSDAAFMTRLDVTFANLYFSALAAGDGDASRAPAAWRPLLRGRYGRGVARLQFALAGMNAHINRDLPRAIVDAFETAGGDLLTDDARHRDFDSINPILSRVEDEVKPEFSRGLIGAIDDVGGRLDDVVAMWNVAAAREAAWTHAQVLWSLRGTPRLRNDFFERLDRLTGALGRGLLVPVGSSIGAA